MPMKMPRPSPESSALFDALVANDSRFEVKKVFGHPAAFVNGNMCLGTFGAEVFFRLSEEDQTLAARVVGVRPFEPMPGRAMTGYLVLPPSVLRDSKESKKWVERAVRWTKSLPPKRRKAPR